VAGESWVEIFFFFFTLVTGPRRSLSLKLSDTRELGGHAPDLEAPHVRPLERVPGPSLLLSSLELSDAKVYKP